MLLNLKEFLSSSLSPSEKRSRFYQNLNNLMNQKPASPRGALPFPLVCGKFKKPSSTFHTLRKLLKSGSPSLSRHSRPARRKTGSQAASEQRSLAPRSWPFPHPRTSAGPSSPCVLPEAVHYIISAPQSHPRSPGGSRGPQSPTPS